MSDLEREAPPASEEIHLPGPSIVPLLSAAGLALALFGLTFHWILVVAGGLLFLATLVRWMGDVRRDIAELPLEHGSH